MTDEEDQTPIEVKKQRLKEFKLICRQFSNSEIARLVGYSIQSIAVYKAQKDTYSYFKVLNEEKMNTLRKAYEERMS